MFLLPWWLVWLGLTLRQNSEFVSYTSSTSAAGSMEDTLNTAPTPARHQPSELSHAAGDSARSIDMEDGGYAAAEEAFGSVDRPADRPASERGGPKLRRDDELAGIDLEVQRASGSVGGGRARVGCCDSSAAACGAESSTTPAGTTRSTPFSPPTLSEVRSESGSLPPAGNLI